MLDAVRKRVIFRMSCKIHFSLVLLTLFLLQAHNHGDAAPLENTQNTRMDTVTENDLLEGDMIIDQTVLNLVINSSLQNSKRSAVTNGINLWPNGIVPYVISRKLSNKARTVIQLAIDELHRNTCIRFKSRRNEYEYVEFLKGKGCYSHVGRQYGSYKPNKISLGTGCESVGIALHEMVHTLGFFHTSSRTDRDAYVVVYEKNIEPGKIHNFKKYSHGQIDHLNSPYDITSIMHLPRNAFARSRNLVTIEARAGAHIKLGETGKLSPVDKYQLNALYKCSLTTATSSSCLTALGIQNGLIPDTAMTASSSSYLLRASYARLNKQPSRNSKGAWCPTTFTNSWLEIDLGQLVKVTGVATQGLEGLFSDEYTPNYDLKYKRSYYNSWFPYYSTCRAYGGIPSLPGNWDGKSVQYNALSPTIWARYVRLYPKSWVKRPCFRVEIYGCRI